MTLFPVLILAILFLVGIPVAIAMILCVIPYFQMDSVTMPVYMIVQRMIANTESISLMAIPFFISAGAIMNHSGITRRLMDLAEVLVGHMVGGLGQVNILLSTMMGGLSGSCAADAAQESKILVPEMLRRGYDKPFCAAVTAASSLITPVIPPGIGLVLYGFLVNVSVGQMFVAGYIPGLIMMAGLMMLVHYLSKKRGYVPSRTHRASGKEIGREFVKSLWALGLPVLLIVGLRFGVFTATEGGAICALYSLFVGKFVYKELEFKMLPKIMVEAVLGTCSVMLVMCTANVFAYYMSWERIPHVLSATIATLTNNKYVFILIVNVLFLILGMFLEGTPSMIILVPLLFPTVQALGIDPVHFGIIVVMNICIGAITPPFGVIIYLVAPLLKMRVAEFIKELWPFIGVLIAALAIVTYLPDVFMWLPRLVYR